jgi:hypothetical protein
MQITLAARSKAWTVFARSNTGVIGSNPTRGMDVCVRVFCVYAVLCIGSGLATGWSPAQGVLPTVYSIEKLKKRPRFKELHNLRVRDRRKKRCGIPLGFFPTGISVTGSVCISHLSHWYLMYHSSHICRFDHSSTILRIVQITKILCIYSSPSSQYLLSPQVLLASPPPSVYVLPLSPVYTIPVRVRVWTNMRPLMRILVNLYYISNLNGNY